MVQDGWTEWSQHVLKELERLNNSYEVLRDKIENIQKNVSDITNNDARIYIAIDELKHWKKEIDAVMSPSQCKELQKTVDDLKVFKVKAITTWIVLHTIVGALFAIYTLYV